MGADKELNEGLRRPKGMMPFGIPTLGMPVSGHSRDGYIGMKSLCGARGEASLGYAVAQRPIIGPLGVGLYVHVPFCARKCAYCDFTSFSGREGDIARYRDALIMELESRMPLPAFDTVFFGGGTPSLPPPDFVPSVLEAVRERANIASGSEITCEANPGTLTREHVAAWREAGVNRLSLGAQARQVHLLAGLGRIHLWEDVQEAAALWSEGESLSLDLMYGLPGQTLSDWAETLAAAADLSPGHLSCYSLIVEEGTPLFHRIQNQAAGLPSEDEERGMHAFAKAFLCECGYTHYEISNWERGGRACRHNLHTWQRKEYIGVGCAAASFLRGVRSHNLRDLDAYLAAVESGRTATEESEALSKEDELFEELMLGLRLVEGIDLSRGALEGYGAKLSNMQDMGLADLHDNHVRLTARGMDVMNAVLVELMP